MCATCSVGKAHFSQAPWHAAGKPRQGVYRACTAEHTTHDISRPLSVSISNKAALSPAGACYLSDQQEASTHTKLSLFLFCGRHLCVLQEQGRRAVGEADAVAPLISLLDSAHAKVRSRAVGALHNLSSDSTSIRTIRRSGGIPKLVALLRWSLSVVQ